MSTIGVDKNKFFNNMNYEISRYYFKNPSIVDYDILDCLEFHESNDKDGRVVITTKIDVRSILYQDGKIKESRKDEVFSFVRREGELFVLHDGKNYVKCPNCGASCDVTHDKCDHCRTELKHLNEWVMIEK